MNALQIIQQKLKAPKSQVNKFGGYNYRNQEDILEAVKPLLAETNSVLTIEDEIVEVGGSLFVKAIAKLEFDINVQGNTSIAYSVTAYAMHAKEQKGMNDAQITGAASSYARKYALNGLFLIDDTKDADATNDAKTEKKDKSVKTETPSTNPIKKDWLNPNTPNWTHVVARMKTGMTIDDVKKSFQISKANETKLLDEAK